MSSFLQLGDIIRILAPSNKTFHENTFYIRYIDPNDCMEIVHVTSLIIHTIPLKKAKILEPSIENILIVNRSIHKGFARQNGLLPNTWVDMEFSGDIRSVIIAQITRLEEDMIELVTYPEKDVLYIDFAYKGLPKHIPFKHICICNKPTSYDEYDANITTAEEEEEEEEEEAHLEYNDDGELIIDMPAKIDVEKNYRDELHEEYTQNKQDSLTEDSIDSTREVFQEKVQYGIEAQMNFLLDDFLSVVPDEKRTKQTMKNIYTHLNRFKELRETFSTYDGYGHISGFVKHDPKHYKPLVETLYCMKNIPKWIIPVANVQQHMFVEKVNDEIPNDVIVSDIHDSLLEEEKIYKKMFAENNTDTDFVKYENMYKTLNRDIYTPHSIFMEPLLTPLAEDLKILQDIDLLLGTNQTLESSSARMGKENAIFMKSNNKMMRFVEPIKYSRYLNKMTSTIETLMEPDAINIQSIVYLPENNIQNSTFLYGNILQQTKFKNPYLFGLLKESEIINTSVDITKESSVIPYKDTIVHSYLSHLENTIHNPSLKHPNYKAFLQALVPNIFSLIEHYYADNANKYNLHDYMSNFHTYGYRVENLSFTSMKSIQRHTFKNIQNYYDEYKTMRDGFVQYLFEKYTVNNGSKNELYHPIMDKIFLENSAQKKEFRDSMRIPQLAESEIFKYILDTNNGKLLHYWVLMLNLDLISPVNMFQPFIEEGSFHNIHKKYIAKKYETLSEMQEDNNKRDLKFDEEYDYNPYNVLNKYKKEMSQYPPEQFLDFLVEKLSEDYGCSIDIVRETAEELVNGSKLVKENDYALLEIKPHLPEGIENTLTKKEKEEMQIEASVRKKMQFFKRVNHVWVYDADVKMEDFSDPRKFMCLLENGAQTDENKTIFKNEYGNTMEEIQKNIRDALSRAVKETEILNDYKYKKSMEIDNFLIKLGNKAYISEYIQSPNAQILDKYLHKSLGFDEKQLNIIWFVDYFCREAFSNENANWKYCKDSEHSVPLVPTALYELALSYKRGEYSQTFSQLVKNKLIKYEDGRFIVSHGGMILDDIEFSDQNTELMQDLEEQDTWEADDTNKNMHYEVELMKSGLKNYTNTDMRFMFNIISSICRVSNIPLDKIESIAMDLCIQFLARKDIFMGKKKYDTAMKKRQGESETQSKAKQKTYDPYEVYENSERLKVAVCSVIIAIQSLTPSYEYRKSVGNCVKILDGYPLNPDSGHDGTIVYFSCILRKMRGDRKTQPWSTVSNQKGNMEEKIKKMINIFLKHEKVESLLQEKRRYLETKEEPISESISIFNKWIHFLPPLKSKELMNSKTPLRNLEKSVNDMLGSTIRGGSHDQWRYLGMYYTKSYAFSIGFIEIINQIVQEKGPLLRTFKNQAWLENGCCNELDTPSNPLEYFGKEDERLLEYKKTVITLQSILHKVGQYMKSPYLHTTNSQLSNNYLLNSTSLNVVSEEIMYKTFIGLCNLDSITKPIPLHFEKFINKKIDEYNPKGSIIEKMDFLKKNNVSLNINTFQSLISEYHRHNQYIFINDAQISYQERVLDSLNKLKQQMETPIMNEFSIHFENYVNRETKMVEENIDQDSDDIIQKQADFETQNKELLDNLENFFLIEIDKMKLKIQQFMREYAISLDSIDSFFNVLSFEKMDVDYLTINTFVKNYLYYLCIIVPAHLIKKKSIDELYTKNKLLNLDLLRVNDSLKKKYAYLNKFQDDEVLVPLLEKIIPKLRSYYKLFCNYYGFFPKTRISLFERYAQFTMIFIVHYMIEVTEGNELLEIIFKSIRKSEEDDEELLESDDDIEEIILQNADRNNVQIKVLSLLQTLFSKEEIFYNDKKKLLLSYDGIRKNVERLEEMEKMKMMSNFDPKNIPEHRTRKAEKELKKYHLGKYYVDQKIINTYGTKRDKMLNTDDIEEQDFIMMDSELQNNMDTLEEIDDVFGEDSEPELDTEIQNDDEIMSDEEEYVPFIQLREDDDNYDIAEHALDN